MNNTEWSNARPEQLNSHGATAHKSNSWMEFAAVVGLGAVTLGSRGKAEEVLELFPKSSELVPELSEAMAPAKVARAIHQLAAESDPVETIISHRMPPDTPETAKIKALVSDLDYKFVGKMERGTNGAYLIKDGEGVHHIFKLVSKKDVTSQISMSARAAAEVDSLAARTPAYKQVEHTPPYGSWYVQELLPGKPAPTPSDRLIGQMITLNDRQAGKAIAGAQNWTAKLMDELASDKSGWRSNIRRAGDEGADLVAKVEKFIGGAVHSPTSGDIVHGDFQHYNALVSPTDRLTGYVDWEGAGTGDRSIDTSRLLYDAYVAEREIPGFRANPETLKMLADKIQDVSGAKALKSYMGYWILQVADFGANMGRKDLSKFASVGRRIMSDLAQHQS
jgi:hypothetical protein